ncbi:hypothetical protein [Hyalangium versicolor]|uniref:hypothetical protein n=1 Tax=Hyalangium versicolor TaxID=2861190 RepID=UPI001CCC5839|nr:hypothetical protein [Hyalangium versicolor]
MKPLVKNLAAVLCLAGTGPLLVADSANKCPFPAQDVTFSVSGTCGPEGTLRAWTRKDSCNIELEGAQELGLGMYASLEVPPYDLKEGGWRTWESRTLAVNPDGQGLRNVSASHDCTTALEDGLLIVRCEDVSNEPNVNGALASCEALLTPQ